MSTRPSDQIGMAGHDYPLCAGCKHVIKMGTLDGLGWKCREFPEGIPVTIVDGTDSHREPYPGTMASCLSLRKCEIGKSPILGTRSSTEPEQRT